MVIKKATYLDNLNSDRLKVKMPIYVSLELDHHQYIAVASNLNLYGCGDTETEAMNDLQIAIVELYFDLKGDKLAKPMIQIWKNLNDLVKEV